MLAPDSTLPLNPSPDPVIEIELEMTQPWTHYFEVKIVAAGLPRESIDFIMPVWTPGSYLVREFARNVQEFSARDGNGRAIPWEKVNKHTWRVSSGRADSVEIRYRVYAFELSVRTSFLNDAHAFINGASVFMYVDGCIHRPHLLKIIPHPGWRTISTGLQRAAGEELRFNAPDYDRLVDCPIEIGNHRLLHFDVRGIEHSIAICGDGNYEAEKLRADIGRIVEAAVEMFGEIPYDRYTFLLHLLPEGSGGLEHSDSCSLIVSRWAFQPEDSYRKFLYLAAHEFFHVWNVKRIRPRALGPFDYTRENYTRLLWVAEGITDYYGYLLVRRAGLASDVQYLEGLSKRIQSHLETPGRFVDTLAEASFDAWIKYYRRDEHSPNAIVSYYAKGELVGLILDVEIRRRTKSERSLDDVLRLLHHRFCGGPDRGFTDSEFQEACEEIAGGSLEDFFRKYASGTDEIEFESYLGNAGLTLAADSSAPSKAYLGISTQRVEGKCMIAGVTAGTPGYSAGLNAQDEILALDGFRVSHDTLAARIEEKSPGSHVVFTIARHGVLRDISVALGRKPAEVRIDRILSPTPEQKAFYESWMKASWESPAPAPSAAEGPRASGPDP